MKLLDPSRMELRFTERVTVCEEIRSSFSQATGYPYFRGCPYSLQTNALTAY
jgi:hypothetical protein